MVEFTKDVGFRGIDPVDYYKSILANKHSSDILRFIDIDTAAKLSKIPEYANIMLKHPYYNIRATYASITNDVCHQNILSADDDWRVRAGLATNKNLAIEAFEKLKCDSEKQVKIVIDARSAPTD